MLSLYPKGILGFMFYSMLFVTFIYFEVSVAEALVVSVISKCYF
jgi:hypothetical protein